MKITQKQFDKLLQDLAEKNWKVKKLLEEAGSYNFLSSNIKRLIDKELKITRKQTTSIEISSELIKPESTKRHEILDLE